MDNNTCSRFPKVDLNKVDGFNPSGWVTQIEHYFALHGITNDLIKLKAGVLYLVRNDGNGGSGVKKPM